VRDSWREAEPERRAGGEGLTGGGGTVGTRKRPSYFFFLFLFFFIFLLLFICADKAWFISPPCPHPLPYHPLHPLPLPPSIPSRN
jgi:hypothetical protein